MDSAFGNMEWVKLILGSNFIDLVTWVPPLIHNIHIKTIQKQVYETKLQEITKTKT